jgi:hypothetical protein
MKREISSPIILSSKSGFSSDTFNNKSKIANLSSDEKWLPINLIQMTIYCNKSWNLYLVVRSWPLPRRCCSSLVHWLIWVFLCVLSVKFTAFSNHLFFNNISNNMKLRPIKNPNSAVIFLFVDGVEKRRVLLLFAVKWDQFVNPIDSQPRFTDGTFNQDIL